MEGHRAPGSILVAPARLWRTDALSAAISASEVRRLLSSRLLHPRPRPPDAISPSPAILLPPVFPNFASSSGASARPVDQLRPTEVQRIPWPPPPPASCRPSPWGASLALRARRQNALRLLTMCFSPLAALPPSPAWRYLLSPAPASGQVPRPPWFFGEWKVYLGLLMSARVLCVCVSRRCTLELRLHFV